MNYKIIDVRMWKGTQSWNYRKTVELLSKAVKACIKRDSYKRQSYAKCYVLKDDSWNILCSIPVEDCAMITGFSHQSPRSTDIKYRFNQDADELFELAKKILSLSEKS